MSRGWHPSDAPLAGAICAKLADAGLQLIGDAEDHSSSIEERIAGIMDGCGAFAAVLPHRPTAEHKTSKYILREWGIAAARNLPCLVVRDIRVELPPEAAAWPGLIDVAVGEQEVGDMFVDTRRTLLTIGKPLPVHRISLRGRFLRRDQVASKPGETAG